MDNSSSPCEMQNGVIGVLIIIIVVLIILLIVMFVMELHCEDCLECPACPDVPDCPACPDPNANGQYLYPRYYINGKLAPRLPTFSQDGDPLMMPMFYDSVQYKSELFKSDSFMADFYLITQPLFIKTVDANTVQVYNPNTKKMDTSKKYAGNPTQDAIDNPVTDPADWPFRTTVKDGKLVYYLANHPAHQLVFEVGGP